MLKKPIVQRTAIIAIAIASGVAVGTLGFGTALADANYNDKQISVYSTNVKGQTFGSIMYAESIEKTPDLIRAEGEDGTIGYVLKKDLFGELAKNPEEALAQQNERKDGVNRKIPLYDTDGTSVIGSFDVSIPPLDEISKCE